MYLGRRYKPPFFFIMAIKFNEHSAPNLIEEKFFKICDELLSNKGYGVYDLRYLSGSSTLRVFITKKNDVRGIDINDCVFVDKLISPYIDGVEWLPDNFVLEISSPGIYRDIRNVDQLRFSIGELIKIKFNSQINDEKLKNKVSVVTLLEYDDEMMLVRFKDDGIKININYETIKSVNAEVNN